jgi:hypothetical protein
VDASVGWRGGAATPRVVDSTQCTNR